MNQETFEISSTPQVNVNMQVHYGRHDVLQIHLQEILNSPQPVEEEHNEKKRPWDIVHPLTTGFPGIIFSIPCE